jgi:hypothetical protein
MHKRIKNRKLKAHELDETMRMLDLINDYDERDAQIHMEVLPVCQARVYSGRKLGWEFLEQRAAGVGV